MDGQKMRHRQHVSSEETYFCTETRPETTWLKALVCINAANKALLSSLYFQLKTMQLQSHCGKCGFSHQWIYSVLRAMKSLQNRSSLQAPAVREICWESCCKLNRKHPKQHSQHLFPTSQSRGSMSYCENYHINKDSSDFWCLFFSTSKF